MITFKCRRCMMLLTARDDQVGETIGCPGCGTRAEVPLPAPPKFGRLPAAVSEAAGVGGSPAASADAGSEDDALGGPPAELGDDFYLDDSKFTPPRRSARAGFSIALGATALALGVLVGAQYVGLPLKVEHLLLGRMLVLVYHLLPVVSCLLGAAGLVMGIIGWFSRPPGYKAASAVGTLLSTAAFLIGFTLLIYTLWEGKG